MAWRDPIARVAPGLFTPANRRPQVLTPDQPQARAFLRAAGMALYPSTGFPWSNHSIVPRLDVPQSKDIDVPETLRSNPLVFAPVWRISFRLGAIPLKVYEFLDEGGRRQRREAMNHAAYTVLRKPNPDLTRNLLISGTVFSMFAYSGVGWWKERADPNGPRVPSNPVIAVWPIPAHLMKPIHSDRRLFTGFEVRTPTGEAIPLPARDVCYFRLMPDIVNWSTGISPTGPLSDTSDFSNAALNAMRNMFRTLLSRIYLDLHGQNLEEGQVDRLRAEIEGAYANPYGVPIMEGGATLEQMGDNANHQLLGGAFDITKKIVDSAFGMPEDQSDLQQYYAEVIQPVADAIEQELERSFMPEFEGEAFAQFAFRQLLAGSPMDRAKLHQIKILSGQETPNDARGEEDEAPIPGGDQGFVPLNVIPLTDTAVDRNAPKKGSAGGLGGDEGRGTTAKLQLPKAAGAVEPVHLRGEVVKGRWEGLRETVLSGQSEGLERRLRGVINTERDQIRELQTPDGLGSIPMRIRMRAESFEDQLVGSVMEVSDAAIRTHLEAFMRQVTGRAGTAAIGLVEGPDEGEESRFRSEDMEPLLRQRVDSITQAFGERRREHLAKLVTEASDDEVTVRQLDDRIRAEWKTLADHLVGRIGETETVWAFERGAAYGWTAAGFPDLEVVLNTNKCRTGMCLSVAVAGRYSIGDVPTPLHPGCKCFCLPVGLQG